MYQKMNSQRYLNPSRLTTKREHRASRDRFPPRDPCPVGATPMGIPDRKGKLHA